MTTRTILKPYAKTSRDIAINLLLCSIVGTVIFLLGWSPDLGTSLTISYVFGLICYVSSEALAVRFPHYSNATRLSIAWFIALGVGSLCVYGLLLYQGNINHDSLVNLGKVLLIAFFFGSSIVYFFYSQEQKHHMREALREAALKQAEKEKELLQSQLKLLQSQIEPHFLFNTLANLKGLIHLHPDKACLLLDKLTDLLRHSLRSTRRQTLTLHDELDFCESYLAIQAIRLGERLTFDVIIDNAVERQQVFPALLLQPLVENAVLHGIEPSENGGNITITVTLNTQGKLLIEVRDTGAGLGQAHTSGHQIGLSNVRNRLNNLYDGQGRLRILENESGGVSSQLELPYAGSQ